MTKPDKKGEPPQRLHKEMIHTNKEQNHAPDGLFSMKFGNTTYTVNVHFSDKFNAMFEDQLKKLLTREIKEL